MEIYVYFMIKLYPSLYYSLDHNENQSDKFMLYAQINIYEIDDNINLIASLNFVSA